MRAALHRHKVMKDFSGPTPAWMGVYFVKDWLFDEGFQMANDPSLASVSDLLFVVVVLRTYFPTKSPP